MKSYIPIILYAFILISCNNAPKVSFPISFQSRYHYDYTTDIIIGVDSQMVNKLYNKKFHFYYTYGGRTTGDSFLCSLHVRRYYISKALKNEIMKYINESSKNKFNCDTLLHSGVVPIPTYTYEISSGCDLWKPLNYCISNKRDGLIYFIGLKNVILNSGAYNKHSQMLEDLRCLFDAQDFFPLPKDRKKILDNCSPMEKKETIENWDRQKKALQKELDDLKD